MYLPMYICIYNLTDTSTTATATTAAEEEDHEHNSPRDLCFINDFSRVSWLAHELQLSSSPAQREINEYYN